MKANLVFIKLRGMNAELGGNFLLGESFLFTKWVIKPRTVTFLFEKSPGQIHRPLKRINPASRLGFSFLWQCYHKS